MRSLSLAIILVLGAGLWWLSALHPAAAPFLAPWEFSWPEYLAVTLSAVWFFRGLFLTPLEGRPSRWRCASFLAGLAAIYIVLQTHFDYMAQHMFFLNRIQYVVMQHLGPFLIALAGVGETLRRGMPPAGQRIAGSRFVTATLNIVQRPVPAVFLFTGLFCFWLIPSIHFQAMVDVKFYQLMNWSMTIDGLLFWSLALDLRTKPPARLSYGARIAITVAIIFPQIALGALLAFTRRDLFPYYDLCGRLFPSIGALDDQQIGGVIIWIPPAMMSVIGALILINAYRLQEKSASQ